MDTGTASNKRLDEFLRSDLPNAWLSIGWYSVYLRRGYHMIEDEPLRTIDLANVNTSKRGKGRFQGLLLSLEQAIRNCPDVPQCIYIENVMHPWLVAKLEEWGYKKVVAKFTLTDAPSLYKRISNENPPSF